MVVGGEWRGACAWGVCRDVGRAWRGRVSGAGWAGAHPEELGGGLDAHRVGEVHAAPEAELRGQGGDVRRVRAVHIVSRPRAGDRRRRAEAGIACGRVRTSWRVAKRRAGPPSACARAAAQKSATVSGRAASRASIRSPAAAAAASARAPLRRGKKACQRRRLGRGRESASQGRGGGEVGDLCVRACRLRRRCRERWRSWRATRRCTARRARPLRRASEGRGGAREQRETRVC